MSVRDHVAIYSGKKSRRCSFVSPAIAVVLCVGACSNGSRTEPITEHSTELILSGDTSPVVTRTLQRGDYLIEAREHEIDLHMTVTSGGARTDLEDNVPRHGAIYQVVSLTAPGEV